MGKQMAFGRRRHRRWALVGRRTRARVGIAVFMVGTMVVGLDSPVGAVHDEGLFELGNGIDPPVPGSGDIAGSNSQAGPDWADLFGVGGALKDADSDGVPTPVDDDDTDPTVGDADFEAATFLVDDRSTKGLTDRTIFATSNKNNDPISSWQWSTGNNPPKDDMANVYGYAVRGPDTTGDADSNKDLYLYIGIERLAPEGDSHLDVEFNQGGIALDKGIPCGSDGSAGPGDGSPCEFVGAKQVNDVLVVMDFKRGGDLGFVEFRRWNGAEYVLLEGLAGEGCTAAVNGIPADAACAFNNAGNVNTGQWTSWDRHGKEIASLERNAFTEIGLNVNALLGTEPCINTIQAKSRSSASFNSELKDFALDAFDVCNPSTDITALTAAVGSSQVSDGGTVVVGSTVDFTIKEKNDGDIPLWPPNPSNPLVASDRNNMLTADNCTPTYSSGDANGNFILDAGEEWTFGCSVTMNSAGSFSLEVQGHGIDHLGRDVTWLDECEGKDGESINIDADPEPDVLCDADEVASFDLTVVNPSTDLTLSVKEGATNLGTVASPQWTVRDGDTVTFTIKEKNDGNADLAPPTATDRLSLISLTNCESLSFVSGDTGDDKVLGAGEEWTFECTKTFTNGASFTVTAFGHGIDALGFDNRWCTEAELSDPPANTRCDQDERDDLTINVIDPSTVLTKTASATITYRYTEANDGDVPLTKPAGGWVIDDACSPVTEVLGSNSDALPSDSTHNIGDADNDGKLDPGEVFEFTCTKTLDGPTGTDATSSITNTATGHGIDSLGADVTHHGDCSADGTLLTGPDPDVWCDGDEVDAVKVEITHYDGEPSS